MNDGIITQLGQFIAQAADLSYIGRLMPDSSVWPHYLALSLRSYMIPVIAYWIGLLLFVLSIAITLYRVLIGSERATAFISIAILAALWNLAVLRPSQNGCDPQYPQYPCVLKGGWQAKLVKLGADTAKKPVLREGNGQAEIEVTNIPVNQRSVVQVYFNPDAGVGNDSVIGRAIKSIWFKFNQTSNSSLYTQLAKHQAEIGELKKAVNTAMIALLGSSAVLGATSAGGAFAQGLGSFLGGPLGVLTNVLGTAVETASDTANRTIQNIGGTLVGAMLFGSLAFITAFHALNTISGMAVYFVLFLAPVIIGLSGIFGMEVLMNAVRFLIVALMIPLITAPIFGASARFIYSGSDTKTKEVLELQKLIDKLFAAQTNTVPVPGIFIQRTNILASVTVKQLQNTRECIRVLSAKNEISPPSALACPDNLEGLFYTDATDYKNKVANILAKSMGSQTNPQAFYETFTGKLDWLPALLYMPQGVDKNQLAISYARQFDNKFGKFVQDPIAIYSSKEKLGQLAQFIKDFSPAYIWSWKAYLATGLAGQGYKIESGPTIRQPQACGDVVKKDSDTNSIKIFFVCTWDSIHAPNASDLVDIRQLEKTLEAAQKTKSSLSPEAIKRKTALLGNAVIYTPLSDGSVSSNTPPVDKDSQARTTDPRGKPEMTIVVPNSNHPLPLTPASPIAAMDNLVISMEVADTLPAVLDNYSRSTFYGALFGALLALFISLILISSTWSIMGALMASRSSFSGMLGQGAAAIFAGTVAVTGANLAASTPRTTYVDHTMREAGKYGGRFDLLREGRRRRCEDQNDES